jgi:hypothetical protein
MGFQQRRNIHPYESGVTSVDATLNVPSAAIAGAFALAVSLLASSSLSVPPSPASAFGQAPSLSISNNLSAPAATGYAFAQTPSPQTGTSVAAPPGSAYAFGQTPTVVVTVSPRRCRHQADRRLGRKHRHHDRTRRRPSRHPQRARSRRRQRWSPRARSRSAPHGQRRARCRPQSFSGALDPLADTSVVVLNSPTRTVTYLGERYAATPINVTEYTVERIP